MIQCSEFWCSNMSFSVFGMKYNMCIVFPMVLYLVYSSNTIVLYLVWSMLFVFGMGTGVMFLACSSYSVFVVTYNCSVICME